MVDLISKKLRSANLKVTSARIAILKFFMNQHGPHSIEELQESIQYNCDTSTLYRNVLRLVESNLIEVTNLEDSHRRYEYNPQHGHHHHHHIVCKKCKVIVKTSLCLSSDWVTKLESLGFRDIKHRLEFFGICKSCSI